MINLILCGGSGTRLWPLSRKLMPKQFNKIFDSKSLFQMTALLNNDFFQRKMILSSCDQQFIAKDQLAEINQVAESYLLEPIPKNTAPAIALACLSLDPDEIVLVSPSDHIIKNKDAYLKALTIASNIASNGNIATFGISPSYPETGYGYIEAKTKENTDLGFDVISFKEKPNITQAQKYLALNKTSENSKFFWNSGMFCFKASTYLNELKEHSHDIYLACVEAYKNSSRTNSNTISINADDMSKIPEESIDYAVMEKTQLIKLVPSNFEWSDLGSFDSIHRELDKTSELNTINENHISIDSQNNLVLGSERIIATVGIEDTLIIDTGDALLLSKLGESQKVKEIVAKVKEKHPHLSNIHLTAHRPWGTYTVLESSPGYQIKRITVKPGKRLSLQKHFHRNEHWIVVSGTATVYIDGNENIVTPNESTYIKMGEVHRLTNNGVIPVVLIEVQVGEYTGEDDIVRIEDDFNRAQSKELEDQNV